MRYIEQLTKYHAGKGLEGDDLDHAVSQDAALVFANIEAAGFCPDTFISPDDELENLFLFERAAEGDMYWLKRAF